MSKRIDGEIACANCRRQFHVSLYRSIWIEFPENRNLIFNDEINVFPCPHCKVTTRVDFPFLCTNVKRGIAVWYEPYHDEQIDQDVALYKKHVGPRSFYALAPRIQDWEAFKQKIIELEATATPGDKAVSFSPEMRNKFRGFIERIRGKSRKDTD